MKYIICLLLLLDGVAQAQLTDHATGTFYKVPSGDLQTTLTGQHTNAFPLLRSDWPSAFDTVFYTTDTALTTITLIRTSINPVDGTITTGTLQIPMIRRRITAKSFKRLNSLYFFDNGILYKRADL